MKFIEVSPFIRFAYKIILRSNRPCTAMDNRLFYIVEGEGTILINGKRYGFKPGTLFLWQAGTIYSIISPARTTCISINFDYLCNNISQSQPMPVCYINENEAIPPMPEKVYFEDCPILNEPLVCAGNSTIYSTLENILFENASQKLFSQEKISALFKDCLINIVRTASTVVGSRSDNAVETVIEYIHENYNKDIDNRTLAELVGYHPYYLNKLFISTKGITLHRYVSNYRIAMAEQMLLSTTLSIDDIAVKIGFSGSLSFSNCFKKKNGITPSEFRKRFASYG